MLPKERQIAILLVDETDGLRIRIRVEPWEGGNVGDEQHQRMIATFVRVMLGDVEPASVAIDGVQHVPARGDA